MTRAQKKQYSKIGYTFVILILTVVLILPFLWMVSTSFKEADEIFHVVLLRLELKRVFVAAGFVVEIRINLRHDFEFAAFVGDV